MLVLNKWISILQNCTKQKTRAECFLDLCINEIGGKPPAYNSVIQYIAHSSEIPVRLRTEPYRTKKEN